MTDKESQLDEIERIALEAEPYIDNEDQALHIRADKIKQLWEALDSALFCPDGLYYKMRRENERLKKEVAYHRECRKLDVPEGE